MADPRCARFARARRAAGSDRLGETPTTGRRRARGRRHRGPCPGSAASAVPPPLGARRASSRDMARVWIGTSGWVYPGLARAPLRRRASEALARDRLAHVRCARDQRLVLHADQARDLRALVRARRRRSSGSRSRAIASSPTTSGSATARHRSCACATRPAASATSSRAVVWQLPGDVRHRPRPARRASSRALAAWPAVRHAIELRHRIVVRRPRSPRGCARRGSRCA